VTYENGERLPWQKIVRQRGARSDGVQAAQRVRYAKLSISGRLTRASPATSNPLAQKRDLGTPGVDRPSRPALRVEAVFWLSTSSVEPPGSRRMVDIQRAEELMAQRTRPTLAKRQREQARIAKQKDKAARRAERARREPGETAPDGVDPDIADIRPGPQPLADWQVEGDE